MRRFANNNNNVPPPSSRPPASQVAAITGSVTYVLVSPDHTDGIQVFVNGRPVPPGSVENVGINIVAPGDDDGGTLTAILSRYETAADGSRKLSTLSLFPGTVEVIAQNSRIQVHCPNEGSFDGLMLRLGNSDGGIGREVLGVQSFSVVLADDLLSAKLVWSEDGTSEDIFSV